MTAQEIMDKADITVSLPDEFGICAVRASFKRTGEVKVAEGYLQRHREVREEAVAKAKHHMMAGVFDDQRREVAEALDAMLMTFRNPGYIPQEYDAARTRLMNACRYVPPAMPE